MKIPTSEKKKEYMREWYWKNREKEIARVKKYQKETNYASEKTESQRKIRYIKRRTRLLFPIVNQKCKFCNLRATEHHHYTEPIEINKFYYVCHNCHLEQDLKLNKHSRIK